METSWRRDQEVKKLTRYPVQGEKRRYEIMSATHEPLSGEQVRTPQRMRSSKFGSIPPSPCATSTTSSPATNRSIDCSFGTNGSNNNTSTWRNLPTNKHQLRITTHQNKFFPPSPSRSVLDPQYASRLHQSTTTAYRADDIDTHLMPPPGIQRGEHSKKSGFFSTPVNSMTLESEDNINTSMISSSTRFFTPERPRTVQANSPSTYYSALSPRTPLSTPRSKRSMYSPSVTQTRIGTGLYKHERERYSDRFIPSRASSNLSFSVWDDSYCNKNSNADEEGNSVHGNSPGNDNTLEMEGGTSRQDSQSGQQSQNQPLLNALLRSELLGENVEPSFSSMNQTMPQTNGHSGQLSQENRTPLVESRNFLRFNQTPRQSIYDDLFRINMAKNPTAVVDSFNLSPVGMKSSHHLMNMPQKQKRKIAKVPFKVLDAPSLADDFYLNLVDWSALNVLAVGLGSCVYLWSACTSKVTKLCDLGASTQDSVTSVAWTQKGTHLAVGVNNGEVQIWDTVKCKKIRTMGGHSARIGALSWSGATLASGSRDRLICLRDVRIQQPFTARLASHKQEVCGLKWSFDEPALLASGGNDNKLLVWDVKNHRQPKYRFAEHTAAVKAIAWSPHQHGLLASGGGTADRCIRFWNALSGTPLNAIDTGSQVCNLSWSKNCNEIVSTHGYSLNQIAIWKYPTMQKVATLTGHTYRVLYLAMSPDGSTIVT